MLYRPATSTAIPIITGRAIAHRRLSTGERALGAADQHLDRLQVTSPTEIQVAAWWRVCVPYVRHAVTIADDQIARADVLAGAPIYKVAGAAHDSETLAEHILRSSPEELKEAGAEVGAAVIWDGMIAPIV